MHYRREIDGLRAVAVLPVILFHAGFEQFSGGYVGVDVFFVISGYLITSIIIGDLEKGRFSIRDFYERRARRILPALFFVMLCCLPFAWLWMLPSQFKDFSQAIVAVSFFSSNILFWMKTDYFAPAAEENPLLHTWSLAVEEQFYIVFPVLLLLLWRFGRNPVFYLVVALSVGSLLLSEWGWRHAPEANFFLIPTRAWELGLGAICAFLLQGRPQRANDALAAAGLALIVFAIFYYDSTTPFPSFYALVPVGGTALIVLFAGPTTLTARLLSTRVLVGVGMISYSAYLWHQPLFAFARIQSVSHPPMALMAGLALATLVLAYLSWRYVEQPFRRRTLPALPSQMAVFRAACTGMGAFVLMGLYGHLSDGRAEIWTRLNPDLAVTYNLLHQAKTTKGRIHDNNDCRFTVKEWSAAATARFHACHERYGPGSILIGDSHGDDMADGLFAWYGRDFLVGLTRGHCRPYTEGRPCQYQELAQFVAANPAIFDEIIYTQAGFDFVETPDGRRGVKVRQTFSAIPEIAAIDPHAFQIVDSAIGDVADYLAGLADKLAAGARVVWIGPRIEPHIGANFIIKNGCDYNYRLRPGLEEIFRSIDAAIAQRVRSTEVEYITQIRSDQFRMASDFMDCNVAWWADSDHWSVAGAERFVRRLIRRQALADQPNGL